MPLGGPYLEQATIDVIRQWITDGAARTASAQVVAKAQPFALAQSSPANGDALPTAPRQLLMSFTRDLDITRLDAAAVHLSRMVDPDATQRVVLPVFVRAIDANPRTLAVVPRVPLVPGRYVLLVDAVALADLAGHQLGADVGTASGVRIVFDVEGTR